MFTTRERFRAPFFPFASANDSNYDLYSFEDRVTFITKKKKQKDYARVRAKDVVDHIIKKP